MQRREAPSILWNSETPFGSRFSREGLSRVLKVPSELRRHGDDGGDGAPGVLLGFARAFYPQLTGSTQQLIQKLAFNAQAMR